MRDKIINFLISKGFTVRDLILVDGGCVIQILVNDLDQHERNKIKEQVITQLIEFNSTLPLDERIFPYRIYSYVNLDVEFNCDGWLKTKYYNPINERYINLDDASILMREIDVEALLWYPDMPFTFKVKINNKNMPIKDIQHYYKELKVAGIYFDLEFSELNKIDEETWELTLYR